MNFSNKLQKSELKILKKEYISRKNEILKRLEDFSNVWNKDDEEIFAELCFCILTPQSKAEVCDRIICDLKRNKLLFNGDFPQIAPFLKRARFYKKKTSYIIGARKFFQDNGKLRVKDRLDIDKIKLTRDWLVENIKGISYKEASHFLRNIGFGENLAILDIHILKNLKELNIIKKIPETMTKKKYLEIENELRKFSDRIKIPMSHLDLLFWSKETGKIFK
jgi:N-glycosylase/DNA lyase